MKVLAPPSEHNAHFLPESQNTTQLLTKIWSASPYYYKSLTYMKDFYEALPPENLGIGHLYRLLCELDLALFQGLLLYSHGRCVELIVDTFISEQNSIASLGYTLKSEQGPPLCYLWMCGPLDRTDISRRLKLTRARQLEILVHEMVHCYIKIYHNGNKDEEDIEFDNGHGQTFWHLYDHIIDLIRGFGHPELINLRKIATNIEAINLKEEFVGTIEGRLEVIEQDLRPYQNAPLLERKQGWWVPFREGEVVVCSAIIASVLGYVLCT